MAARTNKQNRRLSKTVLVEFLKFVDDTPHNVRWRDFAYNTLPITERERLAELFLDTAATARPRPSGSSQRTTSVAQ